MGKFGMKKELGDNLQSLFNFYGNTETLSNEETVNLINLSSKGDGNARDRLVLGNIRLVYKIAKGFKCHNIEDCDLIQAGISGLIKAVSHVDVSKGKFSTYAAFWIKAEITEAIRTSGAELYLSDELSKAKNKVRKLYSHYSNEVSFGKKPGHDEIVCKIAASTNIDREMVSKFLEQTVITSLDAPLSYEDSDSDTVASMIEDKRFDDSDDIIASYDVERSLQYISEMEADIIMRHFGLDGRKPQSFSEIGDAYGKTRAWACQKAQNAYKNLRKSYFQKDCAA